MESTCNNCNYWEPQAAVAKNRDNYGECNKLSHLESKDDPDYIIPVLNEGKVVERNAKAIEYITGASFGCNQFARA